MAGSGAGTVITEWRGDGTIWKYVIDEHGVKVGSMVNTQSEYEARGYTYSAQTGRWERA